MTQYPTHLIDAIISITDADTCKRILDLSDRLADETKAYYEGFKHLKRPKLLHNRVKCLYCGDIIESLHRHDIQYCQCGNAFVDGGLDYTRQGGEDLRKVEDMCEYQDVMKCEVCKKERSTSYMVIRPRLISKSEEWGGVLPCGDRLIQGCDECSKKAIFFSPRTGEIGK